MEKADRNIGFFCKIFIVIFCKNFYHFVEKENISWLDRKENISCLGTNLHCQKMVIIPFCV